MGTDVLRWPGIGTVLRWRHARSSLQFFLLLVAIVVVFHGVFGPQVAPANNTRSSRLASGSGLHITAFTC
jgi:hypothetical protein